MARRVWPTSFGPAARCRAPQHLKAVPVGLVSGLMDAGCTGTCRSSMPSPWNAGTLCLTKMYQKIDGVSETQKSDHPQVICSWEVFLGLLFGFKGGILPGFSAQR